VGLTPASPGFATVKIAPQLDCDYGPHSLNATFSSAAGEIASSWQISLPRGTVSMTVTLPIGVVSATIVVPKPFIANSTAGGSSRRAASATVAEAGRVAWDGARLLKQRGTGILSAEHRPDGVAFDVVGNAVYTFVASDMGRTAPAEV
jgi:hypothetical protein